MSDIREFVDDDNRPYGWGLCSICQCDAEEDDYNPETRVTTCRHCQRELDGDEPPGSGEDVFETAMARKYPVE